ncbi:MAG: flavodoxin [Bacteroidales bacterium]|nr:flavodoxin [Bacteroidales bacterium]
MTQKILTILACFATFLGCMACSTADDPIPANSETTDSTASYFGGKKVLIAYFSWGGTTQRMAEEIQRITGGDLFRIEPSTPYPTDYTECTNVARRERDNDERPAIAGEVENIDDYDVIFIGCPVWWHTAPMIISTFAETYNFEGKTIVPFCTYAATYRDETLQKIVDLTPHSAHLEGLGTTGSVSGVQTWIDLINEQWNEQNATDSNEDAGTSTAAPTINGEAPMSGTVNLWYKDNIPTVTTEAQNSDGEDFIPNIEVFTVDANTTPKGAVIICPGGAFLFRSVQIEGYDVANMLTQMGYQCFVVNYRISPYTMLESATDLQRAIRYVRAHADDYNIHPDNIALVGFSAGGILNGEVLLNWRDLRNASSLDADYRPDALDEVPVSACAIGMIYSFYGRLSVSMNDVSTLQAANLPPAFYCWGTRDGFAGQFSQNATAVREAGSDVQTLILEGYPHGYGTGRSADVWGTAFDAFLTPIMANHVPATSK